MIGPPSIDRQSGGQAMNETVYPFEQAARPVDEIARSRRAWLILLGVAALVMIALFARIMSFELQRDEQFYVAASVLFAPETLYREINFSHLPNLPILLHMVYAATGTEHYLLAGRVVIALAWLASLAALWLFGRRSGLGSLETALLMALLAFNPVLLDAAGMAVTNNFIATPFLLFGLLAFLRGLEGDRPAPGPMVLAGLLLALGAGFKANYALMLVPVGVAVLLMPAGASVSERLRGGLLPLAIGGIIGALPTLWFLAQDPEGFIARCVSFHRGPQIGYWLDHAAASDPKAIGARDKLLMAHRIWLSGTTMLLPLLIVVLLAAAAWLRPREGRGGLARLGAAPILLMGSIVVINALASFLPTPSFPQYHSTAFAFAILLIGLMLRALGGEGRAAARPAVVGALALALLSGGLMLLPSLARLPNPASWTGVAVHEDARGMARAIRAAGPVATLLPIYPLEAGLPVYPHLALGQFIYRASDYIRPGDRRHFANLASPESIGDLLAAEPPSAILAGVQDRLEEPLVAFGRAHGYAGAPVALRRAEENDAPLLMVRQAGR